MEKLSVKMADVGLAGSQASGRLAEHFAQGTGCGQGNTDLYGLVRTDTEGKQHRVQ